MSAPDRLTLYHVPDMPLLQSFVEVVLDSLAGEDLFEYMLPHMPQVAPTYADEFEGQYYCGSLAIFGMPQQYFAAVYELIMQACTEVDSLKPYQESLKAALQADPRYRAEAAV